MANQSQGPLQPGSTGLLAVYCPVEIVEEFIRRAQLNTQNKIETCAILGGSKRGESYFITTLIIPKQEGKQDMCHMTDEIELFET